MKIDIELINRLFQQKQFALLTDTGLEIVRIPDSKRCWNRDPRIVFLPDIRLAGQPTKVTEILRTLGYDENQIKSFMENAFNGSNFHDGAHIGRYFDEFRDYNQWSLSVLNSAVKTQGLRNMESMIYWADPGASSRKVPSVPGAIVGQGLVGAVPTAKPPPKPKSTRSSRFKTPHDKFRALRGGQVLDVSNLDAQPLGKATVNLPATTIKVPGLDLASTNEASLLRALDTFPGGVAAYERYIQGWQQAYNARASGQGLGSYGPTFASYQTGPGPSATYPPPSISSQTVYHYPTPTSQYAQQPQTYGQPQNQFQLQTQFQQPLPTTPQTQFQQIPSTQFYTQPSPGTGQRQPVASQYQQQPQTQPQYQTQPSPSAGQQFVLPPAEQLAPYVPPTQPSPGVGQQQFIPQTQIQSQPQPQTQYQQQITQPQPVFTPQTQYQQQPTTQPSPGVAQRQPVVSQYQQQPTTQPQYQQQTQPQYQQQTQPQYQQQTQPQYQQQTQPQYQQQPTTQPSPGTGQRQPVSVQYQQYVTASPSAGITGPFYPVQQTQITPNIPLQ